MFIDEGLVSNEMKRLAIRIKDDVGLLKSLFDESKKHLKRYREIRNRRERIRLLRAVEEAQPIVSLAQ